MNLDLYRMQKIYVEIYYWVGRVYEYFGFESNIVGEPARTGITIYRTTINYQLSIALNPILPVTLSYHVARSPHQPNRSISLSLPSLSFPSTNSASQLSPKFAPELLTISLRVGPKPPPRRATNYDILGV